MRTRGDSSKEQEELLNQHQNAIDWGNSPNSQNQPDDENFYGIDPEARQEWLDLLRRLSAPKT